ncbi:FAD-dependent oxidoreductase [Nocardia sp. NPDC059239]|uniref:FAD-dependent oxidoreductase n=1 Tax=unclassified Nocardia TaxID=2637762 RepID=UPI0036B6FC4F
MVSGTRPLLVAIVGAGPAGIYTAETLVDSGVDVRVDILERLPAPYGLTRYGVAPDHPSVKRIVGALHKVLDNGRIRLLGNVEFGVDIDLPTLRSHYDAVIFATGADRDRSLDIPGVSLAGSYGAADFVSWYNGHPDVDRTWPLTAQKIAVLGVGNVALDVSRVLAKGCDELLSTDIPPNVYSGLRASTALEVHVFGRRGPAQAKFTPVELRELDRSPGIEVIVSPDDIDYDDASRAARSRSKQVDMVAKVLEGWVGRDPIDRPRKLFLHFFESPVEIIGRDGAVAALRTERTELDGTGNVRGTGRFREWDVQAVYRAVGYRPRPMPGLSIDEADGTILHEAGRVLDHAGEHMAGIYATGWAKRGPIGLIGHTRSCAAETVASLMDDRASGALGTSVGTAPADISTYLADRGVAVTTWQGWQRLDAHERALGEAEGRDRIKVVERDEMIDISASA